MSKEWRNVAITLVLTAIVLIFTTSLMMYWRSQALWPVASIDPDRTGLTYSL